MCSGIELRDSLCSKKPRPLGGVVYSTASELGTTRDNALYSIGTVVI